jgi:hypothetical protein
MTVRMQEIWVLLSIFSGVHGSVLGLSRLLSIRNVGDQTLTVIIRVHILDRELRSQIAPAFLKLIMATALLAWPVDPALAARQAREDSLLGPSTR